MLPVEPDDRRFITTFVCQLYGYELSIIGDGLVDGEAAVDVGEASLIPCWKRKALVGGIGIDPVFNF